jgi:hypothetical protein
MTFQRLLSSPVPTEWAANSAKIVAEIGPFREMNFAHPTTQIREIVQLARLSTNRHGRLRSRGVNRYDML